MPIIGFVGTKDRLHEQFIEFDQNLKDLNNYNDYYANKNIEKYVKFLNKHFDPIYYNNFIAPELYCINQIFCENKLAHIKFNNYINSLDISNDY